MPAGFSGTAPGFLLQNQAERAIKKIERRER